MRDIFAYNEIIKKLRNFFQDKKSFIEVPAQSRLSILAACEDPKTITRFNFDGVNYPLPQTGQMWLEYELLNHPNLKGVFCITTSYRNEPSPIEGRHDKIFPMFEFESRGGISDLKKIERDLLNHLGFREPIIVQYDKICNEYGVSILEAEHEQKIDNDYGSVVMLEQFPERTHPFWNMKSYQNGIFNKIDILLHGVETIGSAERSVNKEEMRQNFLTISNSEYADLLFRDFGEERVMNELDEYLSFDMFPRFGGGIGITRMARAMELSRLL